MVRWCCRPLARGLTGPVVASLRPVSLLVYLCALLPDPGRSLVEQRTRHRLGWPAVPAEYVLCTDDRVVSPGWSRQVAQERLVVHPRELEGGRCPFVARPVSLAGELVAIAQTHRLLAQAASAD